VRAVLEEQFGTILPLYTDGYQSPADTEAVARLVKQGLTLGRPVAWGEEAAGDVVVLRTSGEPSHVGLVLARGWMLHTCAGTASTCEEYHGLRWVRRLVGAWRPLGLCDG
jgi:cell wall-associated NlpC family hydrolase